MIKASKQEFDDLTERQRQVLDLIIDYKTSKEIARILGISHHTVDQHVDTCKSKLGAANRKELARIYKDLKDTCHKMTYEMLRIETPLILSNIHPESESERSIIEDRLNLETESEFNRFDDKASVYFKKFRMTWEIISVILAIITFAFIFAVSLPRGN